MKFNIVFLSHKHHDQSFGLVFLSRSVWVQSFKEPINLNPEHPNCRPGSVRKLIENLPDLQEISEVEQVCTVIDQSIGNRRVADLQNLVSDLATEGFMPYVIR